VSGLFFDAANKPDTFSDPPDGKGLLGLFDQVILKIT